MVKSSETTVEERQSLAAEAIVHRRSNRQPSHVPAKVGEGKRQRRRRDQRPAAISKAAVGRLAIISQAKKMGGECHDLLIDEADRFLNFVIPHAIIITLHAGRKTIKVQDVKIALEQFAKLGPFYGYD